MYSSTMSSFGGEYREILFDGVSLLRASNEPCPVCGHPTGNCVGLSGPPEKIAGLGTIPSMRSSQTILVEEDLWETVEISKNVFTKVLRARAGTQISYEKAVQLGIIIDANSD